MLILISPAKKLYENYHDNNDINFTEPKFHKESFELIDILSSYTISGIQKLMKVSNNIAELNYNRYLNFKDNYYNKKLMPAIYMFQGDVYKNLNVYDFNKDDLMFMNENIRILSGLYGILLSFDYVQPYRLEMGTKLINNHGNNLYDFWKENISEYLNQYNQDVINLSSNEYFSVIDQKLVSNNIININFKEKIGNQVKVIGVTAKRMRGLFARHLIKNKIENIFDSLDFCINGYKFNEEISDEKNLIWLKDK